MPPFQVFLEEHRDRVFRFLVASVGPHDAEDCFQDTFISALRAYPRLRPDSKLSAWVLTIAHRKALDVHRARARHAIPVDELPERGVEDQPRDGEHGLWTSARDLPAKQREALLYRFAGDLPYADVAAAMGVSEDAARQSVSQGLKKLRKELVG
ncbi:MAG TPA: RNA polymerase sigma factor [Thermoleophilaceae bacterium]